MPKGGRAGPTGVPKLEKRIDEALHLTRKRGILQEEVWYLGNKVAKYSLACINPRICGADNGRVFAYDNEHGVHHRHYGRGGGDYVYRA